MECAGSVQPHLHTKKPLRQKGFWLKFKPVCMCAVGGYRGKIFSWTSWLPSLALVKSCLPQPPYRLALTSLVCGVYLPDLPGNLS